MKNKLRFIVGPSGSGKSEVLFHELIRKSMDHPEWNYLLLVPEQFTMETQKKMVMMHPRGAVANIDILSFNRLSFRVFEELGVRQLEILDDTGKSLILRKVIANECNNLSIYREKAHMHGFVEEMKSVISELYLYGVHTDRFDQIREQTKGHALIQEKLQDIAIVYNGFQKFIRDKYITKEELLDRLCHVIPDSALVRESEIYFDGFTGFTPVQNQVMKLLLQHGRKVTMTVTVGEEELENIAGGIGKGKMPVREEELFQMSKDTIRTMLELYEEVCGKKDFPLIAEDSLFLKGEKGRFEHHPVLKHLERHLFRGDGQVCENDGSLQILKFDQPRQEVAYLTDYIAYLVREQGMRYRDFAIITGDMDNYGKILADHLNERNIPFFMDNKRSLILNPGVTFIRALLEMIDVNFTYESVFKFLKCGIHIMEEDEVDILDNYVLACGIRGFQSYEKPFQARRRKMSEEEYAQVEHIRQSFIEAVRDVTYNFRKKDLTVRDMTETLYRFIAGFHLADTLKTMEEEFLEEGEMSFGREYGQAYRYIIELFDKLVSLLGDEKMPLREYREILDAGFEEIKVGVIPLSLDQVLVGDIERTRLSQVKVLLVPGVNDGVIPKHSKKSSLLSQSDRNYLKKMELELSPTVRENIFIQKFYLYLNLTKPENGLVLTYSESSMDGSVLRPSYLIGEMKRLFEKTEEQGEKVWRQELRLSSKASALQYLSEHLDKYHLLEMEPFLKELYSYFYQDTEYQERLERVAKGVFFENNPSRLSRLVAEEIAGQGMVKSVSRLEKYAACAYAHFLTYSLQLARREKYEINMADMGILYHQCMELFSGEMIRKHYDFRTISQKEREELVDQCVEKITEHYGNTILKSSRRNEYLIRKMKQVCRRTVWALCEHVKRGDFTPENFEFSFKEGRIDRMDTYEKDGKIYVKIIDYKSGNKKFEMSDVFNGLQIQLVYYMGEALKLKEVLAEGKEIIPAGTFYFNIKSPYIECSEKITDEKLQELLLKEYKMSGLVNDMTEPAVAMDHILEEEKAESSIIPLKTKDLGSPVSASGLNATNFRKMIEKTEQLIDDFTEEILDGHIEKNPYKKGQICPCQYCSYHSICNFDEREFGNTYKKLVKISKPEDVIRELEGKEEEGK